MLRLKTTLIICLSPGRVYLFGLQQQKKVSSLKLRFVHYEENTGKRFLLSNPPCKCPDVKHLTERFA